MTKAARKRARVERIIALILSYYRVPGLLE